MSRWTQKSQHSFVDRMHAQKCQLTTNPIQKISLWEVTSPSDSQEIPRILSNLSLHRSRPLAVSPRKRIQATTYYNIYLRFILILYSHQRLGIQCRLFASGFPTKIFRVFLFSSKHYTCPTILFNLYLITWVIFSEELKNENHHCAIFSSLLLLPLRQKINFEKDQHPEVPRFEKYWPVERVSMSSWDEMEVVLLSVTLDMPEGGLLLWNWKD